MKFIIIIEFHVFSNVFFKVIDRPTVKFNVFTALFKQNTVTQIFSFQIIMEYVHTGESLSCSYVWGSIPARIANASLQYCIFEIIELCMRSII